MPDSKRDRRLGIYPGTPAASNAGQRAAIEAWHGRQPGIVTAREIHWPWCDLISLATGWRRPLVAYVTSEDEKAVP